MNKITSDTGLQQRQREKGAIMANITKRPLLKIKTGEFFTT